MRGGDDYVRFGADFFHAFALLLELLVGQRLGVSVLGLAGLADVNFDEARAERADLLFDDGAGIEGVHSRAEAFGGGDGLEAGDARADDKDASRIDRASGGLDLPLREMTVHDVRTEKNEVCSRSPGLDGIRVGILNAEAIDQIAVCSGRDVSGR